MVHILIVGAGLGGLSCAIACRQEGFEVTLIERSKDLSEIGAGIQLPPNASRVMDSFGLLSKLQTEGQAVSYPCYLVRNYSDGKLLATRPGPEWSKRHFGQAWHVIHRADYSRILFAKAVELGAQINFDIGLEGIEVHDQQTIALTSRGGEISADVIVGADGLRSTVRRHIFLQDSPPEETGDMAYRATLTVAGIEKLPDNTKELVEAGVALNWFGPNSHVVVYPIRHGKEINIVLICPDDQPRDAERKQVDFTEPLEKFKAWDENVRNLIMASKKWTCEKLRIRPPLKTWRAGHVILLGDSCHPTLPYAAQGAAMAVEDAAVLGRLLGLWAKNPGSVEITDVLSLYELIRKERTEQIVRTASDNRAFFHMESDQVQVTRRDVHLANIDWDDPESKFPWKWGSLSALQRLLGFEAVRDAELAFWQQLGQ